MNLTNMTPAWQQFKVANSLNEISEAEILSVIETPKSTGRDLLRRIVQNAFAYSLLISALHGCAI